MTTKSPVIDNKCEVDSDFAVIGSENSERSVSFQVLQDIYNEITGRSEEIENTYRVNYKIEFSDIEQLYIKILQAYEQYNIKSHNCSVSLYFSKDTKEVFSSFERFKMYNSATLSEIERVFIKFNFMIILPKTSRMQSYKIKVSLGSKISMSKKVNDDMANHSKFLRIFISNVAQVSIEYIDYISDVRLRNCMWFL